MISAGSQPLCPLAVSWAVDVSSSLSLCHLLQVVQVRKTPSNLNAPPVGKVFDDPAVPFLILATQAILCPFSVRMTVRNPCIEETLCDHYRGIAVILRFQALVDLLCTRLFDIVCASFCLLSTSVRRQIPAYSLVHSKLNRF